jgi:hypothetical protein
MYVCEGRMLERDGKQERSISEASVARTVWNWRSVLMYKKPFEGKRHLGPL